MPPSVKAYLSLAFSIGPFRSFSLLTGIAVFSFPGSVLYFVISCINTNNSTRFGALQAQSDGLVSELHFLQIIDPDFVHISIGIALGSQFGRPTALVVHGLLHLRVPHVVLVLVVAVVVI